MFNYGVPVKTYFNYEAQVEKEALKPYTDTIANSTQWKEREGTWVGPTPDSDNKMVREYLYYYSEREGVLGKISGCVFRCLERLKEFFWGGSIRLSARDEVADLIWQARKISTGAYKKPDMAAIIFSTDKIPEEIYAQADGVLAVMLSNFNAKPR